jgi:chromosome segregation ATPase
MAHTESTQSLHARCLDMLFARSAVADPAPAPLPPVLTAPTRPAGPAALPGREFSGPQPPPELDTPEGLRAAYEWFRSEKARLDEYTRSQFAVVHAQHQALLAKHMRDQETLALRDQEVNREMQYLAAQAALIQKRSQELSEWEKALSEQAERLAGAQDELLRLQQTSEGLQKDTEAQCVALAKLREEAERLRAGKAAARGGFGAFEAELRQRQQEWEKKGADIEQRRAAMERRCTELEKAEEAVRRRTRELDELEEQLRQEIEAQERKQTAERHELRALRDQLEAQADLRAKQRLAELDDLERRLLREAETRRPLPKVETKPVIRPEHKSFK